MTTKVGVGMSHHRNPAMAGKQAVEIALKKAEITDPDFVFMFASVGYDQKTLVDAVRQATNKAKLIGCSGVGVISNNEADESNFSVGVMVISSDDFYFDHGMVTGLKADVNQAGQNMGEQIKPYLTDQAKALFILPDVFNFNFDRFVHSLENTLNLDHTLPILGGAAGDNWAMKCSYQYCDDEISTEGVAWGLLSGNAHLVWELNHGCIPIGLERIVTKSEGNKIYEIDDKPVLEVLKEYLLEDEINDWNQAIINLCLGFKAPSYMQDYDEYLIRFIPSKDEASGSIMISTEVAAGTSIWMTRRDQEKIFKGIDSLCHNLKEKLLGNQPKMILHVDCASRGKMMFREQQKIQILKSLQGQIGTDIPWLGFFSQGEIGPIGGKNCFHNYTLILAAIY